MCSTVEPPNLRVWMGPPLPTEGRGRRGMEGEIAEDRISLHEGSLVKVGRRVRNGDPGTPAQSVNAKYRPMRAKIPFLRISKMYHRRLGAGLTHYTAPAIKKARHA